MCVRVRQSSNSRKKPKTKAVLYVSAILEVIVAAISAVLSVDPIGHLWIRSCRTQWLSDWYTVLYNPTPDYRESLRCTQEAVYPLYVLFYLLYRPLLLWKKDRLFKILDIRSMNIWVVLIKPV